MRTSELMRCCANVSVLDLGRMESDLQAVGGNSPAEKRIIKGKKSHPFISRLLCFPTSSSLEGDLVLPLGANCSTHQLLAVYQHTRSQRARLRGASKPLITACWQLRTHSCGGHKREVNQRRNLRGGRSQFLCCRRRCSSTSQQNTLEILDAAPPLLPFDMQMCTFIALAVILNEGTLIPPPALLIKIHLFRNHQRRLVSPVCSLSRELVCLKVGTNQGSAVASRR